MQTKRMLSINLKMNNSSLLRRIIVGVIFLTCSCSNAISVSEQKDCAAKYEELVSEIKTNVNEQKRVSPFSTSFVKRTENLLSQCPDNTGLRVLMANIQISLGKNVTALSYITEALLTEPNNAEAINTKGVILSLVGNIEESLVLLKRSLEIDPDNIDFLVSYCSTLESFARYEEAIEACTRAAKSDNAPPVVYYIRGRAYEFSGQKKNAQKDYNKARKLGFKQRNEK